MEKIKQYEDILDLEFELRGSKASVACQLAGVPLYRKQQMKEAVNRAKQALYAAIDKLTLEEMKEYGDYRAKSKAYYASK